MSRPGETIGRYRLLAEVASGGMGSIFLARDERVPGFEKLVALKRIHKHLADDEAFVTMFLDEARVAALVRHANVCGVEDFGFEDGTYYLTMEYLLGEPLSRVMRAQDKRASSARGPRFFAIAARILADACEGLHAAHELRDARGETLELVHRDISPPNIFVGYDGVVRILDFGVAKTARRLAETTVGHVKGKFAYMAPEQLRRGALDRRVDVWALGVVAWEVLASKRLFKRETELETMEAILSHPIPLVSEATSDVPGELDVIAQRALARDPDERYATAREMGRDLTRYLAECGLSAGLADVAEWMDELFPEGRAEKAALLERANASACVDREAHTEPRAIEEPVTAPTVPDAARRRPRSRAPAIALGAVVLAAVGIGAFALGQRVDEPPPAARAPRIEPATPQPIASDPPEPEPREEAVVAAPAEPTPSEPAAPATKRARRPSRDRPVVTQEPAAERGPSAPGTIQVVTRGGWARVRLGGRELGTTPLRTALPPGRHVLELRTEDGQARRVPVTVRSGEVAPVVVDLE